VVGAAPPVGPVAQRPPPAQDRDREVAVGTVLGVGHRVVGQRLERREVPVVGGVARREGRRGQVGHAAVVLGQARGCCRAAGWRPSSSASSASTRAGRESLTRATLGRVEITRYGHSCLLVEDGDARLLLDPGVFSTGFEALRGLTGVLITHAHADHLDADRLRALLEANPDARLHCDEGSAEQLADLAPTVVRDGDGLELGTRVDVVGTQHAVIHEDIPVIPNVGYLVGRFFTPGDALSVPQADVEVLGLPTAAPWLKLSEAVGLLRAVSPRLAFPVHDAVLATPQIWYRQFEALAPEVTTWATVGPDERVPR
jgi:L-ascorbate metabolism protein UlaG (beta-lactamase superfamily)